MPSLSCSCFWGRYSGSCLCAEYISQNTATCNDTAASGAYVNLTAVVRLAKLEMHTEIKRDSNTVEIQEGICEIVRGDGLCAVCVGEGYVLAAIHSSCGDATGRQIRKFPRCSQRHPVNVFSVYLARSLGGDKFPCTMWPFNLVELALICALSTQHAVTESSKPMFQMVN